MVSDLEHLIDLTRAALWLVLLLPLPVLVASWGASVLVGLLQSALHIQSAPLAQLPRLVAGLAALWWLAPWMSDQVLRFATLVWGQP